jgi:excisionase family DNA binding protein
MGIEQHTGNANLLLSVKRVALLFTICPHTLYNKVRLREIPSYRFGRKVLLDVDEVRAALRVPVKAKGNDDAA